MIDFVKVGNRISEYRRSMGLKQEELADLLFVTRQALSKWERGQSVPSIDALVELSKIFGVSFKEILALGEHDELPRGDDLFAGRDRAFVINKIVKGEMTVDIPLALRQMTPKERIIVLKYIKDGKLECDPEALLTELTPPERKFLTNF